MTAIRLSLGSLYNALPRMKTVRIYFSSEFTFPNTYFKANFLRVLFETPEMRFTLLCNTNVHVCSIIFFSLYVLCFFTGSLDLYRPIFLRLLMILKPLSFVLVLNHCQQKC